MISFPVYWACDYVSMLGLKSTHVSKRVPWSFFLLRYCRDAWTCLYPEWSQFWPPTYNVSYPAKRLFQYHNTCDTKFYRHLHVFLLSLDAPNWRFGFPCCHEYAPWHFDVTGAVLNTMSAFSSNRYSRHVNCVPVTQTWKLWANDSHECKSSSW